MKIENYQKVERLMDRLQTAKKAYTKIHAYVVKLESGKLKESDGGAVLDAESLYNFFIGEYYDSEHTRINLTGLCVGAELLKFLDVVVAKRIEELEAEIEKL